MRQTAMVGLACLAGAFIGALIALELANYFSWGAYAWPVGVLLGGAIAYLTYDINAVWSGITRAFNEAIGWRPNKLRWMSALAMTTIFAYGGADFTVFICLPLGATVSVFTNTPWMDPILGFLTFGVAMTAIFSVAAFAIDFVVERRRKDYSEGSYRISLLKSIVDGRRLARTINPIAVATRHIPTFLKAVGRGLVKAAIATPGALLSALRVSRDFVWLAFRYVHSEIRTLCLVDAALGASAGIYFGSPIIGGIIGLIFGVINYEVVSVHWLKLVPGR